MTFNATVIADSVSLRGDRITTLEVTYPRIIHAEIMTHRVFSRNSASTRAIPIGTQFKNLIENPFIPDRFGMNKRGMQAASDLTGHKHEQAVEVQLRGLARSITTAIEFTLGPRLASELLDYNPSTGYAPLSVLRERLDDVIAFIPSTAKEFNPEETDILNVHKQLAGRGLEAYMWHTAIITATEWENYSALRNHSDAQPQIERIAHLMDEAMRASTPVELEEGQWHTPYVETDEFEDGDFEAISSSVARCAAVSYNRQANKNIAKETERYELLRGSGHLSPFEHVATQHGDEELLYRARVREFADNTLGHVPVEKTLGEAIKKDIDSLLDKSANFTGWRSHRSFIPHENNFALMK